MVVQEAPSAADAWCMPIAAFIAFLTIVALAWLCSAIESLTGGPCEAEVLNERRAANGKISSAPELKVKIRNHSGISMTSSSMILFTPRISCFSFASLRSVITQPLVVM